MPTYSDIDLLSTVTIHVKTMRRTAYMTGLFIAFNLMLTNYLYEFDSGQVMGGEILRFGLKIISLALIVISQPRVILYNLRSNQVILAIYCYFLISYLVFLPFSDFKDFQIINCFMTIILLTGIGTGGTLSWFEDIFSVLCFSLVFIWFPLDLYLFIHGITLWTNTAFIGGLGNPSTYGMVCLLIWMYAKANFTGIWKWVVIAISLVSLIMSQAAMPIAIWLFFILISMRVSHFMKGLLVLIILILVLWIFFNDTFIAIIGFINDAHFLRKLTAGVEFLSGGGDVAIDSESVNDRVAYWKSVGKLFSNPLNLIFGRLYGRAYNAGDGQWVGYLTSFGIPATLLLLSIFTRRLFPWPGWNDGRKKIAHSLIFLTLLLLITNRVLDYWPFPLIFWACLIHLQNSQKVKTV